MSKRRKTQPRMQLQNLLPDDILLEILERLPVNSLLRFTSVSKSWEASIKNPKFISSNHHHLRKNSSGSHLIFMPDPSLYNSTLTCCLIPQTSTTDPIPNYNPFLNFSDYAMVVGSSEGLICFKRKSVLYLWNPFIRTNLKEIRAGEIKMDNLTLLKMYNLTLLKMYDILSLGLGFGFAPKSRDHRIVKLLYYDDYLSKVEIYSLASDSWTITKPRFITYTDGESEYRKKVRFTNTFGVFWDGSIYWPASLDGGDGRYDDAMILRFDLEEEKFEEMVAPSCLMHGSYGYTLEVINGFLVVWRALKTWNGEDLGMDVEAHIYRKSNSGSSSWEDKSVSFPLPRVETFAFVDGRHRTAMGGHIIVGILEGEHKKVLVYDTYCDGKNLSFERREIDTGTIDTNLSFEYGRDMETHYYITPVTKTLFLFDEK